MNGVGGNNFLNACGEFHAHAAGIAVNALAHVRQQFFPFCEPEGAGLAAIMAKRNDADDAVNAAIPGIARIGAVIDVVFGGNGGISLGDIYGVWFSATMFSATMFSATMFSAMMVVQDTNATESVAPVGFKDGNVIHVGPNGVALDENERVCIASAVLHIDDAETFVGHGVGFAFGPAICGGFV